MESTPLHLVSKTAQHSKAKANFYFQKQINFDIFILFNNLVLFVYIRR